MVLMSKHCSRFKTTVLAFTLSVTVTLLLLTDLTSTPDNKSIGIKYCQKIREKVSLILAPILKKDRCYCWWQYHYSDINNPGAIDC